MRPPQVLFAVRTMIVAGAIISSPWPNATAQDHLVPEIGSLNDFGLDYAKSLRDVLLKGAAHHYRVGSVICLRFGEAAWVVSITSEGDDPSVYFVDMPFSRVAAGLRIAKCARGKLRSTERRQRPSTRVWLRMLALSATPKSAYRGRRRDIPFLTLRPLR